MRNEFPLIYEIMQRNVTQALSRRSIIASVNRRGEKVTILHSPLRSSWRPAADPEDSSCDENGNASASAGGWVAAPVAQIPDEDPRLRRHSCDTCNAASPDASCDDAATYLER